MSSHFLSSTPIKPRPPSMCTVAIESDASPHLQEHTTPCISCRKLAVHNGKLSN